MKIVAIIQARMGSTRLPGKVLLPLAGRSVLAHVVERCQAIKSVDEVVIATTTLPQDDKIVQQGNELGVRVFRGDEQDVLGRYYVASRHTRADVIVRITSDCPMLDPEISERTIQAFLQKAGTHYCSNVDPRCFPRGLDTEVISFEALEQAYIHAELDYQREHVCPYITERPERFPAASYSIQEDCSKYRWTLDTKEDYELLCEIFSRLYVKSEVFSWFQALELMRLYPHLHEINAHVVQKKTVDEL